MPETGKATKNGSLSSVGTAGFEPATLPTVSRDALN